MAGTRLSCHSCEGRGVQLERELRARKGRFSVWKSVLGGRGRGFVRSRARVRSAACRNVAQVAGLGTFKHSCEPLQFLLPFAGQLWASAKSSRGQRAVGEGEPCLAFGTERAHLKNPSTRPSCNY